MFRLGGRCAFAAAVASSTRACASAVPANTADLSNADSSKKVQEFAAFYTQLTLKEVTELQREIFKQLGHSNDFYEQALLRGMGGGGGGGGGGAAAVAAPAAAAAPAADAAKPAVAAPEKKAAAKTAFEVNLVSFPDGAKIKLIKDLRSVTNDSIKDAKDLVEKKGIVAKNLGKGDAEKLVEMFKANGADASVQ
jgi:large subunit ribosomal protein L7/L12